MVRTISSNFTAVGLAAGAEDDALVGAALVAGGDAGVLPVLGVIAGENRPGWIMWEFLGSAGPTGAFA